jgi:hypothetical protein
MPDRAVVALSEDRQWLVVLRPAGDWMVHHWIELNQSWYARQFIPDTGQSADEVLDAWLEGRTNAQAE